MSKQNLFEVLKISATYTGTLIGAGFASGQEILRFFVAYGSIGLWGLFLTGCLFSWLGAIIMKKSRRLKATSYHQLLYSVLGRKTGFLFDILFAAFLFGIFTIMLAGAGSICQAYSIPYLIGLLGMGIAAMLTILRGIQGISKVNLVITPLLALATISVGISSLAYHGINTLPPVLLPQEELAAAPHWLIGCLIYVSYNLVIASTVLVPLGSSVQKRSIRLWGSILGGFSLCILAFFVVLALILHYPFILQAEIPMLEIAGMQHVSIYSLYSLILLAAMYTTSIACLYGCTAKLQSASGLPAFWCCLILVICGLLAGQAGFSQLISFIFPLFGYFGLFFTLKLILSGSRGN